MKVRNISTERRLVLSIGREVDVDELFDVPDDSPLEWNVPGVFEVTTTAPTVTEED
jgi:hypothetical protein